MSDLSLSTLFTAVAAGLISVLSPCVMPLMPAYLSLISGVSVEEMRRGGGPSRRRVLFAAVAFVLGFSTVFVALGASATALGRWLRSWHTEILGFEFGIAQIAGLLIVAMGLHLSGLLRIPFLDRDRHFAWATPTGPAGNFLFGAAFALGWTPCVGPILGAIMTLAGARETIAQGVLLLSAYAAGLSIPFLLAALSLERFLAGTARFRPHLGKLSAVAGVLLVAAGLLLLFDQLSRLNYYFLFLEDFVIHLEEALW